LARRGRLTSRESEVVDRLVRLVALAEGVWGDPSRAHQFLTQPHPRLGGETPLEAALSEPGGREVEQLLWAIGNGLPA
jgi:putative toxin-antitoxin system antitoxin component (TIGR02293 family)